jgi:hypothetical protein
LAVPSYTEDLTDIATGDESASWVELAGTDQDSKIYNAQGAPAYGDNEYPYIQGSYAVTQDCTKNTAVGSLAYPVSAITVPTDGAIFVWHAFSSPFAMGTYAQGGFRIVLGSDTTNFDVWYTGGQDKDSYPYGGFVNHVINPTITRDNWAGTYTGTINYVGSAVYVLSGPGKGEPHQVDVMRYGRGSAIFEFGSVGDGHATIAGFATQNDNQSYRWGLIQAQPGGYLWKGRMQFGSASNAVSFVDTNKNIFIQWTPKVTANFNLIEVINSGSYVSMNGFTFQCLDTTTASKGRLLMTDPATVYLDSCTFIDMDTFVFNYSSNPVEITNSTFRRCGQITQGGATIEGCLLANSTAATSLVVDTMSNVTNCEFISAGTGHAVTYRPTGAGPFNVTWLGNTDSGYAATDGSTNNETMLIYPVTTDVTINLTVGAGSTTPTIMEHASYTGAFDLIIPEISLTISSNVSLVGAEIRIYDVDTTPPDFGTELAGVESHDAATYIYNGSAANVIYIQIMLDGYEEFGQQTTMPTSNGGYYALLEKETNA